MEPGPAAAIGGSSIAVGVLAIELAKVALKRRRNSGTCTSPQFVPNGFGEWRGKTETLVERQIDCTSKIEDQSAEQLRVLEKLVDRMDQHETREQEAWRDMFALMRDLKDASHHR